MKHPYSKYLRSKRVAATDPLLQVPERLLLALPRLLLAPSLLLLPPPPLLLVLSLLRLLLPPPPSCLVCSQTRDVTQMRIVLHYTK